MADTFPRQYARTRRLTLGEPRSFVVSSDGTRVVFARSGAGDDPVNGLWVFDVDSGEEIHVVDAADLLADADAELPAQERARRERTREQAGGIVSYATNADASMAAFALAGRLFTVNLLTGAAHEIHAEGAVFDPRPDPTGTRVAYVSGRSLCIADLDGTTRIIEDPDPNVSWGSAEFIAAEEMGRYRGYWWAPDGDRVAACRVDISNVDRFHLADPADPSTQPTELAYPAAGTANADVVLAVISLDGDTKYLGWDRETYPYLVSVQWNRGQPLTFLVQSRDQRSTQVLVADNATLATRVVSEDHDDAWVEVVPGSPAWAGDRLVTAADRDGSAACAGRRRAADVARSAGARDRGRRGRRHLRAREPHRRADRAARDADRVRRQGHAHHRGAGRAHRGRRRTNARRAQLDAHDVAAHLGVEARQGEPRDPHERGASPRRAAGRADVRRAAQALDRAAPPPIPRAGSQAARRARSLWRPAPPDA